VPADGAPRWAWQVVPIVLGALLLGVVVASIVALDLLLSVGRVADRALREDVAFEDEAEDVHVAVLDLRGKHAILAIVGPTRAGVAELEASVAALRQEIDELEQLGVQPAGFVTPAELRSRVDAYEDGTLAALPGNGSDIATLDAAFDRGLETIEAMELETASLDAVGTARAADALDRLGNETGAATLILVLVVAGVVAAGLALSVVAIRVIRELRRLTAAEREAATSTRALLEARTAFIADASHELRTPLTVLRGNADLGARMEPVDDAHVPVLESISAEAMRMARIVDELLFLARHDAGAAPLDLEEVELEVLAADIGARGEALARQRGATLVVRSGADGRGALDASRIEQAALILVDNATVYAAKGGPIVLMTRRDGDAFVLEVADGGPGIPAELLSFVFDRFRRGERARSTGSGAGLGLSIARAIAAAHGGDVTIDSSPAGTRVTLRVPAVRQPRPS
jgi:signal transduction histidine kinase